MKEKSKKITKLKQILFLVLVLLIARIAMYIVGNGNISSLEGYLYSLAATATASDATSSNATSSNAQVPCATGSNATSSNATSSNAQNSCATSSNATSSNAVVPNTGNSQSTSVPVTTTPVVETTTTTENEKVEENKTEEIIETEIIVDGVYDNSELTDAIITNISKDEKSQSIIIDATKKSTIDSKIFEAMKGKNQDLIIKYNDNEIVFSGNDIIEAKNIDVALTVNKIENNSEMSRLVNQDGILVEFMPNGELPGEATIRIKLNDDLKTKLEDKNYIYLYNEEANNFSFITSKLNSSTDDLYEFVLDHNSKYIIVNEALSEELLDTYEEEVLEPVDTSEETEEKEVVSFLESHRTYVIIIGFSILAIIIVAFIIFIDKKGIEKRKKQAEAQNKKQDKTEQK